VLSMPIDKIQPNSKDVARRAGVSRTTVSFVLNGRQDVSIPATTRQRVLQTAQEMGYRPNLAARALVTGMTQVVAVWMVDIHRPHFARALQLAWQQAAQYNFEVIIGNLERHDDPLNHSRLAGWPVDGILAFEYPERVDAYLDTPSSLSVPIVSMGAYHSRRTDFVGVDLAAGTRTALEHLLEIGCGRIAYLVQAWGNHTGDARYDAYTSLMREAGREPEYIVAPQSTRAAGRDVMLSHVKERGLPDGLFCFNDDLAIGACRALNEIGARLPDDIAVVGCDGTEDTEFLGRSLSTIVQPLEPMCQLSWQFLKQRMEDPTLAPQQVVLQPQLVVRESSRR
jgi:LacI family transcriptional regulator